MRRQSNKVSLIRIFQRIIKIKLCFIILLFFDCGLAFSFCTEVVNFSRQKDCSSGCQDNLSNFAIPTGATCTRAKNFRRRGNLTKDPVLLQNGDLSLSEEDIQISGRGLSLDITRVYNSQLSSATDANKNTTTYEYDKAVNLIKTTDSLGNVTQYTYDGNDNRLSQTVYLDNQPITTLYEYDWADNLTKEINPDNTSTTHTYDLANFLHSAVANRLTTTDANSNVTTYEYDSETSLYYYRARYYSTDLGRFLHKNNFLK